MQPAGDCGLRDSVTGWPLCLHLGHLRLHLVLDAFVYQSLFTLFRTVVSLSDYYYYYYYYYYYLRSHE